jgi:hypothetical protein
MGKLFAVETKKSEIIELERQEQLNNAFFSSPARYKYTTGFSSGDAGIISYQWLYFFPDSKKGVQDEAIFDLDGCNSEETV